MNAIFRGPRERPERSDRHEEQDERIPETPPRRGLDDAPEAYPAILPPEPWPDPDDQKGKGG